ncbi:MAG: SufE family protein [Candidatus Latescibacteria bacterium]|jgi:cysteine desulfuration protein SufE|nr:SufE family protein [Candidatus Latescibacterota bacterium]
MTIDQLIDDFEILDDWEDRYQEIIDLGKKIPGLIDEKKTDAYRVKGCVSQVWLVPHVQESSPPVISFDADSDAHIVKGLVAILLMIYSGKTAREILDVDIEGIFTKLDLTSHLSPSRSNGFHAMVARIRSIAEGSLAA